MPALSTSCRKLVTHTVLRIGADVHFQDTEVVPILIVGARNTSAMAYVCVSNDRLGVIALQHPDDHPTFTHRI